MSAAPAMITQVDVILIDYSCPYNEIGPLAMPDRYRGSGLCKGCQANDNGGLSQLVTVNKCIGGKCDHYTETWLSGLPTTMTSLSLHHFSTTALAPTTGVYTLTGNDAVSFTSTCTRAPQVMTFDTTITRTVTITTAVCKTIRSGS